jgi:UvrD-like helicase C-terminal domain
MIANRAWVLLPSGRRLDLLNPDPQAWTDHDLAVGLSRTYRWAGYSAWDLPLSVAQHSLTVLAIRQGSPGPDLTPPEALRELLHDAEEALLGGWDPITPLKPHLGPGFDALVQRLQAAVSDPVEIVRFRNADTEASGIVSEISRRQAEGLAWDDMAVLYRSNALSRSFEQALMHARIPYALIGDVGFYQRAEIKDALALLTLAATPDDAQADEAFRRVINVPARSFGAKAMDIVEVEAAWRQVPLLVALETAPLPPKARAAGLGFVDAIRRTGRDPDATLADQLSLLLDATGYRGMLRESRAESSEGRLENLQELVQLAGGFHTARELLDHAALSTGGPDEEETGRVQLMTLHKAKGLEFPHVFLPAWEAGVFPPDYGEPAEERRLAYVAITRGMHRVTISYCDYRRGPATPSLFLDDIPDRHRVAGWLHQPGVAPVPVRRRVDSLNAAELLQRF